MGLFRVRTFTTSSQRRAIRRLNPSIETMESRQLLSHGLAGHPTIAERRALVAERVLQAHERVQAYNAEHTDNPQSISNGVAAWAVGGALISLILFLIWHFTANRKTGATWADYGLTWAGRGMDWRQLGKSLLLAFLIISGAYLLLNICDWAFKTDFRFWVVAVKLLSPLQFRIALAYVFPFALYSVILGLVLHGQLRNGTAKEGPLPLRRALVTNALLLIAGVTLLILVQYIPLLGGGTLANPAESLLSIVAFQFVFVLAVAGLISTYFFYRTGHIWVGAFVNAMLITWIVVGGTATQFAIR